MTWEEWLAFMVIWVAVSIPLGPNALNCITSTLSNGFARGLWAVAGVMIAAVIHMSAAVLGVAAFLPAHPMLFDVIRWLGVFYLAWTGLKLLRSRESPLPVRARQDEPPLTIMRRAVFISLSNPKALFVWFAVFSQFIDPAAPLPAQLAVLGPSALLVGVIVYTAYAASQRTTRTIDLTFGSAASRQRHHNADNQQESTGSWT